MNTAESVLGALSSTIKRIDRVGSTVTCEPPVMDTDIDYLVLTKDLNACISDLVGKGCVLEGNHDYNGDEVQSPFASLRLDKFNFIVTANAEFHVKFMLATSAPVLPGERL